MKKSTGWRLPLLFCAVIIGVVSLIYLFLPKTQPSPDLPPAILEKARAMIISLDGPEGKLWQDRILDAATGFSSSEIKDQRLLQILDDAVTKKRLDVASAVQVHLHSWSAREQALNQIFSAGLTECETLPWCVLAISSQRKPERAESMQRELTSRWRKCHPDTNGVPPQ